MSIRESTAVISKPQRLEPLGRQVAVQRLMAATGKRFASLDLREKEPLPDQLTPTASTCGRRHILSIG